jgi:hypothetical protein
MDIIESMDPPTPRPLRPCQGNLLSVHWSPVESPNMNSGLMTTSCHHHLLYVVEKVVEVVGVEGDAKEECHFGEKMMVNHYRKG